MSPGTIMWLQLLTRTQLREFWIFWPPAANPYTAIKERLLSVHTLAEFEQGQRLINSPLLGDDKPSVLLPR